MVYPTQATKPVLQVWLDFVCPYCLLGESAIMQATDGLEFEIEWMPFELRPYPNPTLRPEDEYLPRVWKQSVYPLAQRMGIPISLPSVSPQPYSRLAFIGYQFAKTQGNGNAYVDAVLKAFFQKNFDIGSADMLALIAREVGLPEQRFVAALHDRAYADMHDAALNIAREKDIRAVPTLEVNGRRFEGVPPVHELRRVLQEAQSNAI
jgi:predicted DsbA family dithiol-disulfide isomerase